MYRRHLIIAAVLLWGALEVMSAPVLRADGVEADGVAAQELGSAGAETDGNTPPQRQRPGSEPRPTRFSPFLFESVPDINSSASEFVPVPDRWRQLYVGKWYDPYNQNLLKGDIPIFGTQEHPWFLELGLTSDSLFEYRNLPTPVVPSASRNPESTDTFGGSEQKFFNQNLIFLFSLYQGNTTFKPQDFEFRFAPVVTFNYADIEEDGILRVDTSRGNTRSDEHVGVLELFADVHLANITDRYDFISTRVGVQPFNADFRGFIYNVAEPGVRVFGNWDNNLWQYNLAYFRRVEKDTNSGFNTWFHDRYEDVVIANLYHQDVPVLGHQIQASVIYRADQAGDHKAEFDNNGILVRPASIGDERPKNIYTTYFGINGDGHFGRLNITESFYYVRGSESHNQIAGRQVDISAGMAALEFSYDIDWMRVRSSFFWASGDDDAFDGEANGFDAIFDNPNFAGGDISFWQRQGVPFIGGGLVNLVNRNSLLANLRPGKEQGQSNFVNPGTRLYNAGVDFEVLPTLKLINNVSYLQFDQTDVLETTRQDGSISRDIGIDLSSGLLYRPFLNNNVQFRLGGAVLLPSSGAKNLFGDERLFSLFSNVIFVY
jgi:hypothetical protein